MLKVNENKVWTLEIATGENAQLLGAGERVQEVSALVTRHLLVGSDHATPERFAGEL